MFQVARKGGREDEPTITGQIAIFLGTFGCYFYPIDQKGVWILHK